MFSTSAEKIDQMFDLKFYLLYKELGKQKTNKEKLKA